MQLVTFYIGRILAKFYTAELTQKIIYMIVHHSCPKKVKIKNTHRTFLHLALQFRSGVLLIFKIYVVHAVTH